MSFHQEGMHVICVGPQRQEIRNLLLVQFLQFYENNF